MIIIGIMLLLRRIKSSAQMMTATIRMIGRQNEANVLFFRNEIVRLSPFAECSETIKLGGIILIIVEFFVEAGNAVSYVDTAARVILSVHNMDNGTGLSLTLHVFSDKKLSVYRFIYI